jgi:HK97 family phage portal protein
VTLRERLKSTFSDGYLFNGEHRDLPEEVRRRAHSPAVKSASLLSRLSSAFSALKSVPFGETGSISSPVVIYPNMNAWQDAISASLSGGTQPSSDPHLSSLVAAGVTWLANTLPEPDLLVKKNFRRKRGGKKREDDIIERHPFYQLLEEPNPEDTGSDLWKCFAYSWIIKGNVYFIKFRNAFGQVVRLEYEPHFKIRARWFNDKQGEYIPAERSQSIASVPRDDSPNLKINYFEVNRDGRWYRLEPADVIHFKDGKDPFNTRYGLSRIQTMFREIYGDSAVASYAADLLGGNGIIPYVVGIDDKDGVLSQEDLNNIKAKIIEQTTGQNAGKGLVLSARASFNRTGLTPSELDLRGARSMSQDVFSQVTGIPQIVLNFSSGMERSIYNNMSEADRRAVTSYLCPIWWHRDQVLTRQLLRDMDTDESHFIESDLSEVAALQEDQDSLWTRLGKAYQDGWLMRSEVRTEAGYEANPDGADDVYFIRSGSETVTIEQEEEMRMQALKPPAPPQIGDGQDGQQPLQLVQKKQGLLKGAPETVKQLYSAK